MSSPPASPPRTPAIGFCPECSLPHPPMTECALAYRATILDLLQRIGSADTCQCGEPIFWVTHASGKRAPYNHNGLIHFATCPTKFAHRRTGGAR